MVLVICVMPHLMIYSTVDIRLYFDDYSLFLIIIGIVCFVEVVRSTLHNLIKNTYPG